MNRARLNFRALRAFEAAARWLNLSRAATELNLTHAALSQQVRMLEDQLGVELFRRLPRGLALTDAALALLPRVQQSFDSLAGALEGISHPAGPREPLAVGVVGTFAAGWLASRLDGFSVQHPRVELRLSTHNNRPEVAAEGLDLVVRFGAGRWSGLSATRLLDAPLAPLCTPTLAQGLASPEDLARRPLLRSYFVDDWRLWFEAAGAATPLPVRGPVFDSSLAMVQCALKGLGVALAPPAMFRRELDSGQLLQLFPQHTLDAGGYWLAWPAFRPLSAAAQAFSAWLLEQAGRDPGRSAESPG